MDMIKFEWDENKNRTNQNKHGISFTEAQTVFYDDEALVIDDPEHSEEEERFIILGLSTINIDSDAIDYFKKQSESAGIPYQTLINLYLKDCAQNGRQLKISWQ